jgi:hypothetical protein
VTVDPHAERHERKNRKQRTRGGAARRAYWQSAQWKREKLWALADTAERQRLWDLADDADRQVERGEPINEEGWTLVDYAYVCDFRRDLYYQTAHWRKTSRLQRVIVPYCERCGSPREHRRLVAHHRNYDRPGEERVKVDLETLCSDCHDAHHGGRLPVNWALEGLPD